MTKIFTAVAMLQLIDDGALSVDDPLSRWLSPDLLRGLHVYRGHDHSASLTIEHLLSQTSGIADYFEGRPRGGEALIDQLRCGQDQSWDAHRALAWAKALEPQASPAAAEALRRGAGRAYYADTNYQLLGLILEAVSERSLAEILRARIVEPLGLERTYLYGYDEPTGAAAPATIHAGRRALSLPRAMRSFWADGALVSTVGDTLRFLRGLFAGELLRRETLEAMQRFRPMRFPLAYGMGMMRFALPRWMSPFRAPPTLLGHSGASGSFAFFCPGAADNKGLYLAGTVDQAAKVQLPFQLLLRVLRHLR